MSVQEVFEIVDELQSDKHFGMLTLLTNDPFYEIDKQLSSMFLPPDEVAEAAKKITLAKDKLVAILLGLSVEEAQEISKRVEGTGSEYEKTLVMLTQSNALLYKQKIAIAKVFWPEYDMIRKLLTRMIEGTSHLEPDDKESRQLKEKMLFAFESLQELLDDHIIDEDFIVQVLDYWRYKKVDPELINDLFAGLIQKNSDLIVLEKIVATWQVFLPERASRRLRRMLLEITDSHVKKNVQNALKLIGEDTMQAGDTYHITNTGGIINIKADLGNATQTVNNSPNIDQAVKNKLEELLARLDEELEKTPPESIKDAEAVAKSAKMFVSAADEEKPDKELFDITADRLMKAAQNIAKVMPIVLPIAKQIIALLAVF